MPVKSNFAAGNILTASDTNTYLTNGGLVYITETTIGSAVSSVAVANCFSSTYDNYVITVAGGVHSVGGAAMTLQLGSTTTGYYYSMIYTSWNNTVTGAGAANVANWVYMGSADTSGLAAYIELNSPFLAKLTRARASIQNGTNYGGTTNGLLNNTTSYTGFTLALSGGTMTGGVVRVYGMRQA